MDDDYGADADLLAAMATADTSQPAPRNTGNTTRPVQQPTPQKIQQPTPQRLDRAPPTSASSASGARVTQPTPQALPQKQQSGSAILVSPRQRGNPVLACVRSMPWEYSDIPADYVMGLTTCALFLSLKYHRLHPEYIYTRIRNLQGKYNLRIMLTLVDIPNHEDSLRELAKTSLVNNVTIMLCWSAAEAARYIELYKSYESASFGAIKGQQPSTYADKLTDFVTVPRSLNKSDAIALVANFGSLKNAINAEPEHLSMVSGWGGVKVKRWIAAMDEPFRARKAAKRDLRKTESTAGEEVADQNNSQRTTRLNQAVPLSRVPLREMSSVASSSVRDSPAQGTPNMSSAGGAKEGQFQFLDDEDDEDALLAAAIEESKRTSEAENATRKSAESADQNQEALSGGIAAALAKLRDND